jgi:hypothetical protein
VSVRWVDDGDNSGWLVTAGPKGRESRRLFVARKHGGKEACRKVAEEYEPYLASLLEAQPAPQGDTRLAASLVAIAKAALQRMFRRKGAGR